MEMGTLIRQLRRARKLTLKDVAERTRVDQATLSRIETGKMLGTVECHRQIAHVFGLRLSQLYAGLDDEAAARERISIQTAPATDAVKTYSPGQASWQTLTTQVLQKKMLPSLVTIAGRGETPVETLPLGTERFLYLLDGAITVRIEQQSHALKAGQTIYFDAHLPHRLLNPVARAARCLLVTTPPAV